MIKSNNPCFCFLSTKETNSYLLCSVNGGSDKPKNDNRANKAAFPFLSVSVRNELKIVSVILKLCKNVSGSYSGVRIVFPILY